MRQNQNHKRSRGRGRRGNHIGQQNFNRNTTFESNGPEGRLRGNAQQLFEKYTALAQDAQASGERISFEAFSQFADHYYRIHQTILAASEQRRSQQEDRQQRRNQETDAATSEEQAAEPVADDAIAEDSAEGPDSKAGRKSDSNDEGVSQIEAEASGDDADTPKEAVA
jgi:hypothetical protein